MTDAELQQPTNKLVESLRRAKRERTAIGHRIFEMKHHLSNLGGIVDRAWYDEGCSELIVGKSDSRIETVDRWPTYDDLKSAIRQHAQLEEQIQNLQAKVRDITGLDRELLS